MPYNAFAEFLCDSSPETGGPKLKAWTDNQGDLYFQIFNSDGKKSEAVRLCGPGGDSRHGMLSLELSKVLFGGGQW